MKRMYLLLFMGCLVACTKIEIEDCPTEGEVNLSVDWTDKTVPAGMRFYFYRMEGDVMTRTGNNPVIRDASASGFAGSLPKGTYRVLAVNTDGKDTELTGMDEYCTATVVMKENGSHLGRLYSYCLERLEVNYQTAVEQQGVPVVLTKDLRFQFALEGVELKQLSGSLCGVYPSVLLSTGLPSEQSVASAPVTEARFEVDLSADKGSAELRILGIQNPQEGDLYKQTLVLTATTLAGQQEKVEVDLSKTMTKILVESGGALPVDTPVELGVEVVAGPNTELTAKLTSWQTGGKSEAIIE